jgi:hypothetical protein
MAGLKPVAIFAIDLPSEDARCPISRGKPLVGELPSVGLKTEKIPLPVVLPVVLDPMDPYL